jgi:hypothetical protein
MVKNDFGMLLAAKKLTKSLKITQFTRFWEFSRFFFQKRGNQIIEIHCFKPILIVCRFNTSVFMPKTSL